MPGEARARRPVDQIHRFVNEATSLGVAIDEKLAARFPISDRQQLAAARTPGRLARESLTPQIESNARQVLPAPSVPPVPVADAADQHQPYAIPRPARPLKTWVNSGKFQTSLRTVVTGTMGSSFQPPKRVSVVELLVRSADAKMRRLMRLPGAIWRQGQSGISPFSSITQSTEQVMDTSLRCRISPGMFTGEVAVRSIAADGAEFSLFVSDDFVKADAPVTNSGPVNGWLLVELLAQEGDLMLVRLPGQAFEAGQTVSVRCSHVERRPWHQAV